MYYLKEELELKKQKLDELNEWLNSHTQHPDFMKIAGDRNAIAIRIQALEFKIDHMKKGLPVNGEQEIGVEERKIFNQEDNGFRTIQ